MIGRVKTQLIEWNKILPTLHLEEYEYPKLITDFPNKYS